MSEYTKAVSNCCPIPKLLSAPGLVRTTAASTVHLSFAISRYVSSRIKSYLYWLPTSRNSSRRLAALCEITFYRRKKPPRDLSCEETRAVPGYFAPSDKAIIHCQSTLNALEPVTARILYDCGELKRVLYYGRFVNLDWTAVDLTDTPMEIPNRLRLRGLDTPHVDAPLRIHGDGDLEVKHDVTVYKVGARSNETVGKVNGMWERVCLDPKLLPEEQKRYADEVVVIADAGISPSEETVGAGWLWGMSWWRW
ncbi:hypothetical protein BDD12DRAFT_807425 [Trichophaea hybrida]|nr:hypothetical protein BDD12DRAFT_807425 [Trichophaea hybrida]